MRIKSIKFIEHIVPNMSCGTGYSEPDKFEVTLTNNIKFFIYPDIWYVPNEYIKEQFVKSLNNAILEGSFDNIDEAYEMYLKELEKN